MCKSTILIIPILACALLLSSCAYIVLPEGLDEPVKAGAKGWTAVATGVSLSESGEGLRIELTLRNETLDWSAMKAVPDKPAILTGADGKTTECDAALVSSGGHRLAPGFQMRGYTVGTKAAPETQMIYVDCPGAEAPPQGGEAVPGARLSIEYSYVTGEYNYYYQDQTKTDDTLEVSLDEIAADLTYPIAQPIENLILKPGAEIPAINDTVLTLAGVERGAEGFTFVWHTANPGEYPTDVHVGLPPVIGSDGIIYGLYASPDLESVPITPAGDEAEWSTQTAVPAEVSGCYILLSVESKKQRLFLSYAIDITDK